MKQIIIRVLTFIFIGIILGLGASFIYLNNRLYPGMSIAGISMSSLTKAEAQDKLRLQIEQNSPDNLVLTHQNTTWELSLKELQYNPRISSSIDAAFNQRSIIKLLTQQLNDQPVSYGINNLALEASIATISAQLSFPAQKTEIQLVEDTLETIPGQDGQELPQEEVIDLINNQLAMLNFNPIQLPVKQVEVAITSSQLESTLTRGQKFLSKTLAIHIADNREELDGERIISLLNFKGGYDAEKIAVLIDTYAESYDHPPQNALLKLENGKVTAFKPADAGQELKKEQAAVELTNALMLLENLDSQSHEVELSVIITQPEIVNQDVNSLGINDLIGKGVSYFTGSASGRIHNLSLAATRINGTLIPPGEEFSFNNIVGDISYSSGYQAAYVIKDGRTVLGDGGGVCQDSTTLFRAVLDAGLPVTERKAHSYRVVYYEKGNFKPGLDATVYAPSTDFRFKNDTTAYILIQTKVEPSQAKLTYEIYGTSDGRVSAISNHRVWDQQPPPEPLYQDDPSLPAGSVKQVDFAAWGSKTAFDYTVTRNGETLTSRTFFSNFRPWQAVYLRGTGV
ncbi:MAG: VanW family protein [bacterium]|nr:VanW family protein [bacterium]